MLLKNRLVFSWWEHQPCHVIFICHYLLIFLISMVKLWTCLRQKNSNNNHDHHWKLVQWKLLNMITDYIIIQIMWSNEQFLSCLIWSQIMWSNWLSQKYQFLGKLSSLWYCYHLYNVISFSKFQSDHNKQLALYKQKHGEQ